MQRIAKGFVSARKEAAPCPHSQECSSCSFGINRVDLDLDCEPSSLLSGLGSFEGAVTDGSLGLWDAAEGADPRPDPCLLYLPQVA